ncbi:MAG: alpha/beta hydrolase [Pseudonocardiaceae bacterium]
MPEGKTPESLNSDARNLADEIGHIVHQASQADSETLDALNAFSTQNLAADAADAAEAPPLPPPGTPPAQVNAWWDRLSVAEQMAVIAVDPIGVGMTDGIPAEARDAANRILLDSERERLTQRRDELIAIEPGHRTSEQQQELVIANRQLDGIEAIDQRLDEPRPGQQQAYLLGLDTDDLGQAIVAIGNPDEADNVVTFVPGTYTQLSKAGQGIADVEVVVDQAQRSDPTTRTAGVLWIGYDAPQSIPRDATRISYAEDAGEDLDSFQDGLRATHQGPPANNTVLGHSYGSTVVGVAARDERLDVDNIVLVGSPGVGVDHASELGIPRENVWATAAENDPIASAIDPTQPYDLVHGNDPTDADFGGQVFASDPGSAWPPGAAHLEYWQPDSPSLINFGHIVAGRYEAVER